VAARKQCSAHDNFLDAYSAWTYDESIREIRLLEPQQDLKDLLASERLSYEQRISISTETRWISGYYFVQGTVLCFNDPDAGWRIIKRALLYDYWDTRITLRARDFWRVARGQKKKPSENALNLTIEAALALVMARSEAMWYLDLLEQSLSDGTLAWFDDDFFSAYLVRLYRKLKREEDIKGLPPRAAEGWEHPFDDLIDSWDDEEKLAAAILRACDYHLRWNRDDTDEHRAEFGAPVAIVNPVEVHALEAVRNELGLSTPTVEHELLQPPFYPIPDFAKNIANEDILAEDGLLRRVVELNQPWCDGLEE